MLKMRRNRKFISILFAFMGGVLMYPLLSANMRTPPIPGYVRLITKWLSGISSKVSNPEDPPALVKHPPPIWQKFLCDRRNISLDRVPPHAIPLELMDGDLVIQPSENNIFLMETACNPLPVYRAWCSVESWALQNPTGHVWYLMSSPYIEDPTGVVHRLQETYKNMRIIALDFNKMFRNTPVEEFFASMKWTEDTDWPVIQLSDMARIALVWTYGGFYSDTDAISIASTANLYDVIGGFENNSEIANGQFHCRPHHSFLSMVMEDMVNNYDPKFWGSLGPATFKSVLEKHCGLAGTETKDKVLLTCVNMTLLPPVYFTPLHYVGIDKAFLPGSGKGFSKMFKNAYSIHFFNHLTEDNFVKVGSESIYDMAAKQFCPVTYRLISAHSQFF